MDAEKQALKALMKMINEKYAGKIDSSHLEEDKSDLEALKEDAEDEEEIVEGMMERDEMEDVPPPPAPMDEEKMQELMAFLAGGKKSETEEKVKPVFGMTTKMVTAGMKKKK